MKVANLNADSNDLYYDLAQSNAVRRFVEEVMGDEGKEGAEPRKVDERRLFLFQ